MKAHFGLAVLLTNGISFANLTWMTLAKYLEKHDITQKQFSDRLGCSQSLVSQWISGAVELTAAWAVRIERETGGEVKRQDLRPDLYRGMAA